jgi:molybdopterin-containing oxidoreductase family membrane subunit
MAKPQDIPLAGPNRFDPAGDLIATLGPYKFYGKVWIVVLSAVVGWALFCYIYQLWHGLAVTAMTDYFCWGVYIINFVFFIGISMAGTLISAILRLTGAEWRRPITRMAEGITLFALLIAGPMVIVDMGRPDRFFHTIRYARFQSPILWDIFSLMTYLAGSLLYLYLPMIPDMALLRDSKKQFPAWRQWLYRKLALGWQGTAEQRRRLERAISIMAVAIIPVAISIHTVTAWIFGMTLRPGWHSTIIGPDFVVGALYSGIAAVITVMAIFREFFHLEQYITVEHIKKLSLLLLAACLTYFYFTVNEYVGSEYMTQIVETQLLHSLFKGSYAAQFWFMIFVGVMVPAILLTLPWTRTIKGIVTASILVNIGMWLMRYIIVVPTLSTPFSPAPTGVNLSYIPTWVEWSITAGGFAAFALMYLVFSKIFPVISIWEIKEAKATADVISAMPGPRTISEGPA